MAPENISGTKTHTKEIIMKNKSRFTRVAIATGLIVATGASVLGITGFASAKMSPVEKAAVVQVVETTVPASSAAPAVSGEVTPVTPAAPASITEDADNHQGPKISQVETAAKALGMTTEQLTTELTAGKSISDVATTQKVALADVKAALLTALKAHLAEEVASGEHTQAEADSKLAEASTRIDTLLTTAGLPQHRDGGGRKGGHGGGRKGGHGEGHMGGRGAFVTPALATTLKLSVDEIHTQLKSGKSLAAIAATQKVSVADVKATLTADFSTHLAEEVASGEHTQAEADAKKTEFATRLDDMMNRVGPSGMHDEMQDSNSAKN